MQTGLPALAIDAGPAGPVASVLAGVALIAASGVLALLVRGERRGNAVAAALHVLGALVALVGTLEALALTGGAAWSAPLPVALGFSGGRLALAIDGLSAAFLLPLLVVPALCAIASVATFTRPARANAVARARVFFGLLSAAVALVCIARDGVGFLFAWEVMALAAFFLVATDHEVPEVRRHAFVYLIATHVGTLALLLGFAQLASGTGTMALDTGAAAGLPVAARTIVFGCALLGFGVKAGLMPLHVWLPGAHAAAPNHVSAVLSAVVIKTGIYGLCRITATLGEPPLLWGVVVLVIGIVSGVLGVAYALGQHDLKRLLAWHSIENIGIILMGLGLALVGRSLHSTPLIVLGFGACVLHVWNHALFKALLFLAAGAVVHSTGTREIDRLGGLARSMPRTAVLFLIGAVAICGLPPLNGFVSEFLLFFGAFRAAAEPGAAACALTAPFLALIGGLAVACFAKVFGAVFLGVPRTASAGGAHDAAPSALASMAVLALACIAIGAFPAAPARLLESATTSWLGTGAAELGTLAPLATLGVIALALVAAGLVVSVALILRARRAARTVTWDCGFTAPDARMQYTASSFAAGLVSLFGFALRPRTRHPELGGTFPHPAEFVSHVDDVVLERAIVPACGALARVAQRLRALQPARIQIALLYVLAVLLLLVLSLVPWSDLFARVAGLGS